MNGHNDPNSPSFQQMQQYNQLQNQQMFPNIYPNGQQSHHNWTPTAILKPNYQGMQNGHQQLSPLVHQSMNNNNSNLLPQVSTPQMLINPYHAPPGEAKKMDEQTWAETATAMTGATSDTAFSDNISRFGARFNANGNNVTSSSIVSGAAVALIRNETDDIKHFSCFNLFLSILYTIVFLVCMLSPVFMVLPIFGPYGLGVPYKITDAISLLFKMILFTFCLIVYIDPAKPYFRVKSSILPKLRMSRAFFTVFVLMAQIFCWFIYWSTTQVPSDPLQFASMSIDSTLFIFIMFVVYEWGWNKRSNFVVHVIRSPDGFVKSYNISNQSIQEAAIEIISHYFVDFPVSLPQNSYNSKRLKRLAQGNGKDQGPLSASSRIYEEVENEKKIRKRRMRLLIAVEEAFNNIKKKSSMNGLSKENERTSLLKDHDNSSKQPDPYELAQSVFPTLIRPLQKYIRITKQQARHPVDTVLHHLAICIAYNVSPVVFMQKFLTNNCAVHEDAATASEAVTTAKKTLAELKASRPKEIPNIPHLPKDMAPGGQQKWMILVDRSLSSQLNQGLVFQLKRGTDVSLLCTVNSLPLIKLVEDTLTSGKSKKYNEFNIMTHGSEPNTV